ncbi:flavin-containing monooxygenase [Mycobacterium noviomagense]|uniref:Monooxygenase n=2 Tax=Mycobacterium noviomagense TaxID=459858 RepID=A0ABX3T9W2_9MYCO|nr:NAD(P)/FAD-dependent oxidoreductase [Mycobacterium noviomagense]ORB17757.1 monooxygenase [Mycobacterium noviomagense]
MTKRQPTVAIVGAGMSGLCAAIILQRAGIDDVTLYEKAGQVGGTWRENTYPGLTCDVPSRFYQFSFAPNPGWSHLFSPGGEIQQYFTDVAKRTGVYERIRFGTEVVSAEFDGRGWVVHTSNAEKSRVDFLISATGVLHHPKIPDIRGLGDFSGSVFHSARWDHSVELRSRRVAVIGTGSTGVQIVSRLAGTPARLTLFQRTPQWIMPMPNPRYPRLTHRTHRAFPLLDRLGYHGYRIPMEIFSAALVKPGWRRRFVAALCRANLRTVRDPQLREALTPTYTPMCKRLVISNGFYRAMQRDDVELVTARIDHVESRGIVTDDGVLHDTDVIVLATGFDAHAYMRPMRVIGRDGLRLEDAWRDGPRAFETVALPGFPNFFMLLGPHSPVGNFPLTAVAESQADHILGWLKRWQRGDFDTVEPTQAATQAFNDALTAAMPDTVWTTGCDSWYLGKNGLPEVWPFTPARHRAMLAKPKLENYDLRAAGPATKIGLVSR